MNKEELLNVLRNGEVAILPSDTVYGLFGDACNTSTIKKIDTIKGSNKPHLIVVSSIDMLKKYVKNLTPLHEKVMNKYWPNTLTILFEKNDLISDELTKGSPYIGIRMPNNKFLLDIICEFGKPLISTSANITNENVITSVDELSDEIKSKVSFIYDGGKLGDVASTLIKIEDNKITILRDGELSNKIKNDFKDYLC